MCIRDRERMAWILERAMSQHHHRCWLRDGSTQQSACCLKLTSQGTQPSCRPNTRVSPCYRPNTPAPPVDPNNQYSNSPNICPPSNAQDHLFRAVGKERLQAAAGELEATATTAAQWMDVGRLLRASLETSKGGTPLREGALKATS